MQPKQMINLAPGVVLPHALRGKRGYRELTAADYGRNSESLITRAENPGIANLDEWIDAYLYDSFTVAANTAFTKQTLFQTPIGGTKTVASTNLRQNGKL